MGLGRTLLLAGVAAGVAREVGRALTWREARAHRGAALGRLGVADTNLDAPAPVRPAGRRAIRDTTGGWDETDEKLDETFPASDPAATY